MINNNNFKEIRIDCLDVRIHKNDLIWRLSLLLLLHLNIYVVIFLLFNQQIFIILTLFKNGKKKIFNKMR